MVCSKCYHKLPDDSEFCQYCGSKLENQIYNTPPTRIIEVSLSSPDEKPRQQGDYAIRSENVRLEQSTPQIQVSTAPAPTVSSPAAPPKKEKVRYCSLCGSKIANDTKKCTGCGKQYFRGIKLNKFSITVLILTLALTASIIVNISLAIELNHPSSQVDCTESTDDAINKRPEHVYNVGVRTISFSSKSKVESILVAWKNGDATEQSMIDIMKEYGIHQGGGKLYVITRGELIEEIDEWCFSADRQVGDYAIIENAYGYTLCYISGFNIEE